MCFLRARNTHPDEVRDTPGHVERRVKVNAAAARMNENRERRHHPQVTAGDAGWSTGSAAG